MSRGSAGRARMALVLLAATGCPAPAADTDGGPARTDAGPLDAGRSFDGGPHASDAGSGRLILTELEGTSAIGTWSRMEPRASDFPFDVTRDAITMHDEGGANQHIVRRGVAIDPTRPYRIEIRFALLSPLEGGINSFAVAFNVAGPDDDLGPVSTMAINLDARADGTAVMKYMGFLDGSFRAIGERAVDWAAADVDYALTIDVNRDLDGALAPGTIAVEVRDGDTVLERFAQDYSAFPYQPPEGQPVRFGLNTHGADWRAHHLRIAYTD